MTRLAVIVTILSAAAVLAVASRVDQGFYSDPALQMKTVLQYRAGTSSRPNELSEPGPADVSRDASQTMVGWAPGTPLAFLPFVAGGLNPAHAARAVAALGLIAGSIGWVCWFAGFDLPAAVLVAFAVAVPWMRFASNALFLYTPELLVFAVVPWILLGALAAERAGRARLAAYAAIGGAAGALYVVKFSATFVTAGVALWLTWRALRSRETLARRAAELALFLVAAAIPIGLLSAINQRSTGSANLVLASLGGHWQWVYLIHAIGSAALTTADLDAPLAFLLMHPVHGVTHDVVWLSICGFPAGVLLILLASRGRHRGSRPELARALLAASLACMLLVWTLTTSVSIESRHLFSAGFAMLPLALAEGRDWYRTASPPARGLLAASACVFVAAPMAYGVVSVFAKMMRYPGDYRPAASGIYNPLLAQHDAASVVGTLRATFDPAADVWYLVEPLSALDLPGRSIVRHADFTRVEELRGERFLTSRPLRIHALLPPRFEGNGKAAAIRDSFPQATGWSRSAIAGSEYDEWTTVLKPAGALR